MKIEMRLCPDLSKLNQVEPAAVETKEDGIIIFAKNDISKSLVANSYSVLKGTFEEKVAKLEECEKNGKIFFSPYAPSARFTLVK